MSAFIYLLPFLCRYVQDLLWDAFHDSFVHLYGKNYPELIERVRAQEVDDVALSLDVPVVKGTNMAVYHYASQIVDGAFDCAFQEMGLFIDTGNPPQSGNPQTTHRGDRASTSSSCYEDALDFSYLDLEQYAETLAGDIMEEATNTVTGNGSTNDLVSVLGSTLTYILFMNFALPCHILTSFLSVSYVRILGASSIFNRNNISISTGKPSLLLV